MNIKTLIIFDFDNTLYDWVSYFVPSLYRMAEKASTILDCNLNNLLDELKVVHQKYHDAEHPFALLETKTVRQQFKIHGRDSVIKSLDAAFYEFNISRKNTLYLYKGVKDVLSELKNRNISIIGHTEAKYYAVSDRLNRLGLSKYFNKVYCRERSVSSRPESQFTAQHANEISTKIVELLHHQRKPSAEVLTEICEREGVSVESAVYVGDSLFKDILMANSAGMTAVWAEYGTVGYQRYYENLVRVSHWRDEDVEFERRLTKHLGEIRPDFVLKHDIRELLSPDVLGQELTYSALNGHT